MFCCTASQITALRAALAEASTKLTEVKARLKAHLDGRTKQEKLIFFVVEGLRRAVGRAECKGNEILGIDDKQGLEEPMSQRELAGARAAVTRTLQGIVSMTDELVYMYTTELGMGSKNANSEIHLSLLHSLLHHRSERMHIEVRDCAALFYNSYCAAAYPVFTCDRKIWDCFFTIFQWPQHGKFVVDRFFAYVTLLWRKCDILSIETMMAPLQQLRCGLDLEANVVPCIVNPAGMEDWSATFEGVQSHRLELAANELFTSPNMATTTALPNMAIVHMTPPPLHSSTRCPSSRTLSSRRRSR